MFDLPALFRFYLETVLSSSAHIPCLSFSLCYICHPFMLSIFWGKSHWLQCCRSKHLHSGHSLPYRPTGIPSGNCQETENLMVQACHASWQPFQNHPSEHLGNQWRKWCWVDNIIEWTSLLIPELLTMASWKNDWKRISAELPHIPHTTWLVKGLTWPSSDFSFIGSCCLTVVKLTKVNLCCLSMVSHLP